MQANTHQLCPSNICLCPNYFVPCPLPPSPGLSPPDVMTSVTLKIKTKIMCLLVVVVVVVRGENCKEKNFKNIYKNAKQSGGELIMTSVPESNSCGQLNI